MALLEVGDPAPEIEARRKDGSVVRLSELRGRHVLVYFYPKDNTPGCTTEACTLNDSLQDLAGAGADVIGVSTDSWESHTRFQEKHGLRFALAADPDRTIADGYGVGRALGILPILQRVSFLVGPEGTVVEVWPSVKAEDHAAEVLAAVRARQPGGGAGRS
ncbi:MAG: thioredoxin-dependent thiol peroxidase [Candidatus Dormibacteria bacterium]